jgi:PKHD-type hydroxylase
MISDPLYWTWKKELPASLCKAIIEEGLKLPIDTAVVGEKENKVNKEIRESKVSWFDNTSWVSGLISHYAYTANKQAWNFSLSGNENPQFTIYNEGGFYDFHEDCSLLSNQMRKLSAIIVIADSNDYEGGDFEFEDGTRPDIKEQGSILVFPSFIKHRVTPITKGTRYSLVSWFVGPAFS